METAVIVPGRYVGRPYSWDIQESQTSDSKGVRIRYQCLSLLDAQRDEWLPLGIPYDIAEGTVWIIGKDGSPNARGIRDLARVLRWNGDLAQIVAPDGPDAWKPPDCEIEVAEEEYKDKKRCRVAWINELGSKGQSKEAAKRIMSAYGDTFKNLISEPTASEATSAPQSPSAPSSGAAIPF